MLAQQPAPALFLYCTVQKDFALIDNRKSQNRNSYKLKNHLGAEGSEESFKSKPYGFEIAPQKKITIGFYYLNKK